MKSVLKTTAVLVAVLSLTTTVDAATKTRSAKATTKGTRVAAVKKNVAKPAVGDVSAAASDIQLTETAKLSEVKPVVQAKKWSLSGFSEVYGAQMDSVKAGTVGKEYAPGKANGTITADSGIIAGYKIADTMTLAAAYEWGQDFGTADAAAKTTMYDPSIRLSKSDLADLGMGVGLSGQARVYLPLSQASRDAEQIAQVRLYATASREVTKALSASFTLNPRFFAQQNDFYIPEGKTAAEMSDVSTFRLLSSAALKYSFNDKVAVEQTIGVYQKWRSNTDRKDNLDASTSIYVTPVSWLELNLGIRQIDNSTELNGLNALYNDDQTEYYFVGSFSI